MYEGFLKIHVHFSLKIQVILDFDIIIQGKHSSKLPLEFILFKDKLVGRKKEVPEKRIVEN